MKGWSRSLSVANRMPWLPLIPLRRTRYFSSERLAWACVMVFVQPCRDIALVMQYSPNVDVVGQVDVEEEVRIALQGP